MDGQHDQVFLQILSEEKNISNFLNAFFGFLFRCTDFYVESSADQKLGFPPGIAEKLVNDSAQKWKSIYLQTSALSESHEPTVPLPIAEESPSTCVAQSVEIEKNGVEPHKNQISLEQPSDSYNGAIRENYTWSQTIADLDLLVKIPECIKTVKGLKVDITSDEIKVAAKSSILKDCNAIKMIQPLELEECTVPEYTTLLEGHFCMKIRKDESIWSFVPGRHISVHLEKTTERWWDALLEGEPKIELGKIDCSRNLDELGNAEQMKVQELMWNHQQKLLNKPTSENLKMEKMLKKAWNVEGSPFKGTDFDPSVLKFS